MKVIQLLVVLSVLTVQGLAHATSTHLVLLKTNYPTATDSRSHNRAGKYAYVRQVMNARLEKELKPFIANIAGTSSVNKSTVVYLPLINAVGLELNQTQLAQLQANPMVHRIVPNSNVTLDRPTSLTMVVPTRSGTVALNDGLILHQVDQSVASGIDIHRAGKVVGIIDTGIDGKHPDLASKIIRFKNFATNSTEPTDFDRHGTHVAGIIAGGNTSGTQLGVYPGAKLVVAGAVGDFELNLKALQWMLDPDGDPQTEDQPYVINSSWNIGNSDPTPFYIAMQALKDADILICFSAGNAGRSGITKPKDFPATFTSAAVSKEGSIASFSSWGPAKYLGQQVQKPEVSAIGVDVLSTLPGNKYGKMSGTSMASPFTAGAVALLGAHFPQLSPYIISQALLQTSERGVRVPWDKQYGHGLINVNSAYLALKHQYGN